MQENVSKKSSIEKVVINNHDVSNDITNVSRNNATMKTINQNTKEKLGVMALIAIMEPATESQSSRAYKQTLRSRHSNKIKVLMRTLFSTKTKRQTLSLPCY